MENILFANKLLNFILIFMSIYKAVQTQTTCDLQSRLSELLKRWYPCQQLRRTLAEKFQGQRPIFGHRAISYMEH